MVVKAMRALHRMTLTGTAGVPVPSSAEITRKKKWCSWGKPKKSRFSHPHTNALPAFGWDESDAALAATIPFDGYARPILFNDGAFVHRRFDRTT